MEGCEFTINDTITDDKIIEVYEESLRGERKIFPSLIKTIRPDCWEIIIKYLFRIKLNYITKSDVCNNFNGKTFKKYKIFGTEKIGTIMELIRLVYPEHNIYPWELKYGNIHGMYDSDNSRKECIKWFLDKLKEDSIIDKDIDVLKRADIYKLFQRNSIGALLDKFNKSSTLALMWYFNNFTEYKINEWDFYVPPRNFWNKENSIRAFKWLLKEIGFIDEWSNENKKDFIIDNLNKELFVKHKISGAYDFFGNIYEAYIQSFGEELFYQWELKHTPSNFWKNEDNRKVALIQLIKLLEFNEKDIPKYLSQGYFRDTIYNKFNTICGIYYGGNYFYWVDSIMPQKYTEEDFEIIKAIDGIQLSSKEELKVYEYIKYKLKISIKYIGSKKHKKYSYRNEGENEEYRPDFIIQLKENEIVVEYFGLYNPKSHSKIVQKYIEKTHRKIKFFSEHKNIKFMALYPEDLRFNCNPIKKKIKNLQECMI